MDEESANKFISALIKSVQTLCHGYVDFSNGVEIIGHINLNIDKGSSFDYILKEKVCRNDENSTLFISNSFHAQPKGEQAFKPNSVQSETHVSHRRHSTDTSESNKLSSVISSISTALSGSHSQTKSRSGSRDNLTSNTHQSHPVQSTAKRKAEDDISSDLHPVKSASISRHDSSSGHQHFFTSQSPSHPSGSNSPIDSKASFIPCVGDSSQRTSTSLSDDVHSHVTATMLPQTASITSDNQSDIGVNLEGSVLERIDDRSNSETHDKDDSDLDLEVTFIKEEYVEGDRSACEFQNSSGNQALNRASNQRASSDGVQDPPLYPVALHTNASATYVPSSHEIAAMAHYAAAGAIQQNSMGMPGSSQPQPGPSGLGQSGMRGSVSHHQQPPVQPLQPGVRPGCGYVHPDDAKKWMMYELVPGSGVFIHQENYRTVIMKERDGQPDGKAMARYLMSCFWKQSDLVGASIAEPPRPHHRSLDKGIINAILEFCVTNSQTKRSLIRATMASNITKATSLHRHMHGIGPGKSGRPRLDQYRVLHPKFTFFTVRSKTDGLVSNNQSHIAVQKITLLRETRQTSKEFQLGIL